MSDMPYLTVDECKLIGGDPSAVYGGKVYSYYACDWDGTEYPVVHGGIEYGLALDQLKLMQMEAPQ